MKDKLIFLHIMKTGGESIRKLIQDNVPKSDFLIKNEALLNTADLNTSVNIKYYMGHSTYGIHEKLKFKNFKYITMMRNPVERVISNYYYIKSNPTHVSYNIVNSYSLKDVLSRRGELRNEQYKKMVYQYTNKTSLKNYIETIEKNFLFIGLFEEFDESVTYIAKILGVKDYVIPHKNKNSHITKREIDEDTINAIINYNQHDIQLYNLIKKKYQYYKDKIDIMY